MFYKRFNYKKLSNNSNKTIKNQFQMILKTFGKKLIKNQIKIKIIKANYKINKTIVTSYRIFNNNKMI